MMLKSFFRAATIFAVAFATISCSAPTKEETAEKELKEIMEKNQAVGLAVVTVKDGEVIYNKSLGYKDLENKIALGDSDIFRIASISKSFTATAIMQLVEQGKLSLDADVSDLVGFKVRNPKYPETPITVKMLLSHTSSMNDANGYFTINKINPDSSKTWETAWNAYEPGTNYEYCNLGFNTLGTILERISGERFDKYIVNHILNPLGIYGGYEVLSLDSTKFVKLYSYNEADSSFTHSPAAYSTREDEIKNYVFGHSTPVFSPTGGLKVSALDLAKAMMMHMGNGTLNGVKIIDSTSSAMMQSKVAEKTDEGDSYGFAIRISDQLLDNHTMIGHTGSAYGVFTSMFWDKDKKFGFIVMTNGCNERTDNNFMAIHREVDACLYKNFIQE
ncbi:MAG: beta-lactamase family protein [Bacteroidales bacterium]|nr:beta-lactamase family protein [Bacteroidales bacterium]